MEMSMKAPVDLTPASDGLPGIDVFTISPPGLGTMLRISIARPVQPAIGGNPDIPPTMAYVTDADYLFGTLADAARVGSFGGDLAPSIVVGIGYAEETGNLAFVTKRRFLDFYRGPRRRFDAGAYGSFEFGGADAFLAAIADHVIPSVESRFAGGGVARRVLLGTSAGGHFSAFVLSQRPELFQGYAMMSPMLVDPQTPVDGAIVRQQGDGSIVQLIQNLPRGHLSPGTRVFLSAGGLEEDPGSMFADFAIISNAMRMRTAVAHLGAETELAVFPGETHGSVTGGASRRALRFLLPALTGAPDWRAALADTGEAPASDEPST